MKIRGSEKLKKSGFRLIQFCLNSMLMLLDSNAKFHCLSENKNYAIKL